MRKMLKENVIVVCTIVVCFVLTLSLCMVFAKGGAIDVFNAQKVSGETYYAIAIGSFGDLTLARENADLIKKRGGAGYVQSGDSIEIIYAVYKSEDDAKGVLSKLDDKSAYVKKISIDEGKFSWCDKAYRQAVKDALVYFDLAFNVLYTTSANLNINKYNIDDAKAHIRVLYSQIEDIKSAFYKNVQDYDKEQITQIKLALVTTLALLDNVKYDTTVALATSSVRYQIVQLVLCRQALMNCI